MQRDASLKDLIQSRLAAFSVQRREEPNARCAAVALAIVDEGHGADLPGIRAAKIWSTEAALVLTRRALDLRHHAGQWALPGGRLDAGESAGQAALRELHEEVGLALEPGDVIGRLDDFVTRSGFVITPFVVWAGASPQLRPNAAEVASIHRIPIAEFLRADAPMLDPVEGSIARPVLRMPVGDAWIAAPTAALLYQFREVCLLGRATRVAHFEQPAFAWK